MNKDTSINKASFPMTKEGLDRLSAERRGKTMYEKMLRKALHRVGIGVLLVAMWVLAAPALASRPVYGIIGVVLLLNVAVVLVHLFCSIQSKPTRPIRKVVGSIKWYGRIRAIGEDARPVSLVMLLFAFPPMAVASLFGADFFLLMELAEWKWFVVSVLIVASTGLLQRMESKTRGARWLRGAMATAGLFVCMAVVAGNYSISGTAPAIEAYGDSGGDKYEYASCQCNSGPSCDAAAAASLLVATIKQCQI